MIKWQAILFSFALMLFVYKQWQMEGGQSLEFWAFLPLIWLKLHIIVGYLTDSPFFLLVNRVNCSPENKPLRLLAFIGALLLLPLFIFFTMSYQG